MSKLLPAAGVVLFLLAAFPLAAQNLTVEYVEGEALLAAAGGWVALNPGDPVPVKGRIRLGAGGLLELAQGPTRLTVSRPGTYNVTELLASAKKVASWNLGQVVGSKLKGAVAGPKTGSRATTSAGVRAERKDEGGGVEWVTDTGLEEELEQGRRLLEQGSYDEALALFQEALQRADSSEAGSLRYYIAETLARQGRTAQALQALKPVELGPQESMYQDLVLLKGRLLLESLAFNDALELFKGQLRQNQAGGFAQALHILSSYSHRGLGMTDEARDDLRRAAGLDRDSELGREADALLKQL